MDHEGHRESASVDDAYHSSRKETIRADLARRLKKICSHLSERDFEDLVDVMTENKLRGDRRTTI